MKHWLLLLFFFPLVLRAQGEDLFSEDDNPCLFHHVHVISGHLNFALQEVVQGARPIPLMRAYSSGGAFEDSEYLLQRYHFGWRIAGGWSFQGHTDLFIIPAYSRGESKIYVAEPNGSVISYTYSHCEGTRILFYQPAGPFPFLSGKLGAKNNPQNNLIRLDLKAGVALLFLPDGGIREYRGSRFHLSDGFTSCEQRFYRLVREVFPSKHQQLYHYDKNGHLSEIQSTNPAGTKVYASVRFNIKTAPLRLHVKTSDA